MLKEGFRKGAEPAPLDDASKARVERVLPVARGIMKRMGELSESLVMGDNTQVEMETYYKDFFIKEVEPLIRTADLNILDVAFLFQVLLQPFDNAKVITTRSLDDTYNKLTNGLWGQDVDNLKISDLIKAQQKLAAVDKPAVDAVAPEAKTE